jgi:hypothetical protein
MTRQPEQSLDFDTQYRAQSKEVFHDIVRDELARGADADEQARIYTELGKPDFVLAYLLSGALADAAKRDLLARAYERRADHTKAKAHEFDTNFHRPFPMLLTDAARDRTIARQIRAGRQIRSDANRQLPII